MEEGRIVEQATPPIKPDGSYGTGAPPGDEIVPRALMDIPHGCPSWMSLMNVITASSCPRDQIPLDDFHPRGLRRLVRHAGQHALTLGHGTETARMVVEGVAAP